jgi:hypothetical protein
VSCSQQPNQVGAEDKALFLGVQFTDSETDQGDYPTHDGTDPIEYGVNKIFAGGHP